MNIAFVILHYITEQDTKACVESINRNAGTEDYKIIIVDNASPNDSYQALISSYKNDTRIHLIRNNLNLGFARGCNTGFRFAKENLNAEYIVLLNNDTEFIQRDIYPRIKKLHEDEGYAVLGPMMLTKDGKCTCNPVSFKLRTESEILKLDKKFRTDLFYNRIGLGESPYRKFVRVARYVKKHIKHKSKAANASTCYFKQQHKNVKINGACMVFSPEFISRFDGLDDRTFMYFEEDILYLHLLQNGLTTLYSPEIVVFHKEDSATDFVHTTNRKKRRFIIENHLDSFKIYLQTLKEYEKQSAEQIRSSDE